MSLRLRLFYIHLILISGVMFLMCTAGYFLIRASARKQLDDSLAAASAQVIATLQRDAFGGVAYDAHDLHLPPDLIFQVWSSNKQLMVHSPTAWQYKTPLDEHGLGFSQPLYQRAEKPQGVLRVLTVPLQVNGQMIGHLQTAKLVTDGEAQQKNVLIVMVASAVFLVAASAVIFWLLADQELAPLVSVTRVAAQIASREDISLRIPAEFNANEELGKLITAFNQTLSRLDRLYTTQRRFMADVSHELRTPLTVIKGNVGLMRRMKQVDEESLSTIEKEVDRLTRLVDDLLLLAQAEFGKLPLNMQRVALDEILLEVFRLLTVLDNKQHVIEITAIDRVDVIGDYDRIKQVILNLGSNAVKYAPVGEKISLSLGKEALQAHLIVHNTGPNIPEEDLPHVFERFYRGEKSRNRSEAKTGFGLGLSIANMIIRSHQGRIDVTSRPDAGTTFAIWLPLAPQNPDQPPASLTQV